MAKPEDIQAIALRVKELRQELESVEATLREMSGGSTLEPIEPIDSPTVLTTNHAQRRARADRMMPIIAAAGAVLVLGLGIAIGFGLRSSEPPVASTTAVKVDEAPKATVAEAAKPPPPPAVVEPPSIATASTSPSPSAAPIPPPVPVTTVTPVTTAPRPRVDRGF